MKKDIISALKSVTRELYGEGERERKNRRSYREPSYCVQDPRTTFKDVVFDVIPQAVNKATGGGRYPVSARTLFYQVRPLIQDVVTKELGYSYFSQTLLTQYREENGPINELYYDPRGILYEPHTGKSVALGTREVDAYKFPSWLYNKILYIEKKGLWPPLETAKIAERYDLAIVVGEGYATEAARILLENAEKDQNYEIYVLHDADPHGYNIARTLQEETDRMPGYSVNVVDLGLCLEEGINMGLQAETFIRRNALPWRLDLSEIERKYFEGESLGWRKGWGCWRIELNAFTAPALIKYIENKLTHVGAAGKVIPPDEELSKEAEAAYWKEVKERVQAAVLESFSIRELVDTIGKDLRQRIPLDDARKWIEDSFGEDDSRSWSEALVDSLDSCLDEQNDDLDEMVKDAIQKAGEKTEQEN